MPAKSFAEITARRAAERRNLNNPNVPLTGNELVKAFGAAESDTGILVSHEGAIRHSHVYACIKILAESIGMLPINVFKQIADDNGSIVGKMPAQSHPAYDLLHWAPNPEMDALVFMEAITGHVALRGNGYAHIVRNNAGMPVELWPLRPDRVWVWRKMGEMDEAMPGGDLVYLYTPYAGEPVKLTADEVIHFRGMSPDGLIGYSPIDLQANSVGKWIAVEKYGAKFFANDARPGGFLTHPGSLSDKAYNRLMEDWERAHRGFTNAHKMAILEEGLTWQAVGLAPEQAQFLQTQDYNLADAGRMFRIPLNMLNDARTSGRTSAETISTEFLNFTLMPWLRRYELAYKLQLFNRPSDKFYMPLFDTKALIRGDIAARTAYYQAGKQNGWLCADDIREAEDMNPIPGMIELPNGDKIGKGKLFLVPLNMVPVERLADDPMAGSKQAGENNEPVPPGTQDTAKGEAERSVRPLNGESRSEQAAAIRKRLRAPYARLFADTAKRVLKRERTDVLKAADKYLGKRSVDEFGAWLDDFYRQHEQFIGDAFRAPIQSYADAIAAEAASEINMTDTPDVEAFAAAYATSYAGRHAAISRTELADAIASSDGTEDGVRQAITDVLDSMADDRPADIGAEESVRGDGAFSVATYKQGGVTRLMWVGGSCRFCSQFAGRTVSIHTPFVADGTTIRPSDGNDAEAFTTSSSIGHAPLHRGCDCSVVAA